MERAREGGARGGRTVEGVNFTHPSDWGTSRATMVHGRREALPRTSLHHTHTHARVHTHKKNFHMPHLNYTPKLMSEKWKERV